MASYTKGRRLRGRQARPALLIVLKTERNKRRGCGSGWKSVSVTRGPLSILRPCLRAAQPPYPWNGERVTEADNTHVNAAELLTLALRHLDSADTRRPFTEIPTLDDSTRLPFQPFPALAIAMAGHVLSAWEVRTFQVERAQRGERMRFFTAAGGKPRRVFRACTLFNPELGTQRVIELCAHSFCSNMAPAGPGSRCADHLGDPVPEGCGPDHWLHVAGEAAKSAERARGGLTETEALAVQATRAGVPMAEVVRATGVHEGTVHALSAESASVPDDVDISDDPAY
jgi:hypothetical protein